MSWFDNFDAPFGAGVGLLGPAIPSDLGQIPGAVGGFFQGVDQSVGDAFQNIFGGGGSPVSVSGQSPTAPTGQQGQQPSDLNSLLQSLLGGGGTAGTAGAAGAAAAPAGYTTPDGVFINDNSPEDRYYRLVDSVWTKIYGAHPPFSIARTFRDMGIQNTDQLNQVVLQMPSHVTLADGTPITIGVYENMLTAGNKFGQQYFGRPIPDTLIQEWARSGLTTPDSIENWFWSHPARDMPSDQYGAIWDAANQWTQQVFNDFPHPSQVAQIAQSANPVGTSPSGY